MIRIDLHTHSIESPDGGMNENDYKRALVENSLDMIAITDHNAISFAQYLQTKSPFENSVIVGEEISTTDGDIIGLFLKKLIEPGMTAVETAKAIHAQDGFVLIPHPADPKRHGISFAAMDAMKAQIDAIEAFNGRIIGSNSPEIGRWARENKVAMVAASDAHSMSGIGKTYTTLPSMPKDASELIKLLDDTNELEYSRPPFSAYLAPKWNRTKNILRRPEAN